MFENLVGKDDSVFVPQLEPEMRRVPFHYFAAATSKNRACFSKGMEKFTPQEAFVLAGPPSKWTLGFPSLLAEHLQF